MAEASVIDTTFRKILLLSKIFSCSWGSPKTLQKIFSFRKNVFSKGAGMEILEYFKPKMNITRAVVEKDILYMEGCFKSPYSYVFPELMPDNVASAYWCGFFPARIKDALVIHLAGTGDHSFFRRKWGFVDDLMKRNIGSILLENPFYGSRKPNSQFRSNLQNVSDLYVMGAALITECNYILDWARSLGYGPLGLSGMSMGGYMASLACTNSPKPVSLVPCLSWTTAAPVFVHGALSQAIPWNKLNSEFESSTFRNGIKQIPQCDWIERAYEMKECFKVTPPYHHAKQFMFILMEEFTNLKMYPRPVDTSLVKSIVAENDAYIVRTGVPTMQDLWPDSHTEVLGGLGHITAFITGHSVFRRSIIEMLQRNKRIYYNND